MSTRLAPDPIGIEVDQGALGEFSVWKTLHRWFHTRVVDRGVSQSGSGELVSPSQFFVRFRLHEW